MPPVDGAMVPVDRAATDGGLGREAHRNTIANQAKETGSGQQRLDPSMTFEITRLDDAPLHEDYRGAASLLGKARTAYDRERPQALRLKFNSKLIRAGDWMVWAEDASTLEWLTRFFQSQEFSQQYKAILMVNRGEMIKYKVKVLAPDSTTDFDPLLAHLFDELGCFGYVRFTNETRWYKDPAVNEKYQQAVKKRKSSQFKDKGAEYDKFIWIKMSVEAHNILQENLDKLNYYYGVTKMSLEKMADKMDKQDGQSNTGSATGANSVALTARDREREEHNQGNVGANETVDGRTRPGEDLTDLEDMEQDVNELRNQERINQLPPSTTTTRGE